MMPVRCVAHVGNLMCSTTYVHELVPALLLCDKEYFYFSTEESVDMTNRLQL